MYEMILDNNIYVNVTVDVYNALISQLTNNQNTSIFLDVSDITTGTVYKILSNKVIGFIVPATN